MSTTLSIDKAGRIVIPKAIRDKMRLEPGTSLELEIVGDKIELTLSPVEVRIEKRGKRRVVVGWEGFDAAKAVNEARQEQIERITAYRDSKL